MEGSTENTTLVTDLLVGLRERGLDMTRPILVGHRRVQGAAQGRGRRVRPPGDPTLPTAQDQKRGRPAAATTSDQCRPQDADAYHAESALAAEAALLALAKELDRTHPGAAASLREGLAETLTVLRLGVPPTLARTLRSTNCIESMISICRDHATNVKNWRDGQMALRWCAAGMVEAGKQFRRVNGHLHLPTLRAALEREIAEPVGPVVHNDDVSAA